MASLRRSVFAVLAVALASLTFQTAGATAAPAANETTVKQTTALKTRYCTPAQARAKRAGKRVNCVMRPKACFKKVNGKRVKVKCKTVRRIVTPRLAPAAPESARITAQVMALRTWVDENGVDDVAGQKDLTSTSSDSTSTGLLLTVQWDILNVTGSNTADACYLFDADGDGFANTSICVTWGAGPTLQSVTKYTCTDSRIDRCFQPTATQALSTSLCTLSLAADPFGTASSDAPVQDVRASCTIPYTTITTGGAPSVLINTCSYPSGQPNSDPSDCLLIPRDGFLTLSKVLVGGPSGYIGPFTITYTCTRNNSPTITGSESVSAGTSVTIGMVTGYVCSASETPPTPPTGYDWSGATPQISAAVTIRSNQASTLTVTNTLVARPATLTVRKVLTNNSGGTTPVTGFSFRINAGTSIPFDADAENIISVPAGLYNVVENAAAGYTTTYDGCANLNLPPGGSATCTITNDDIPALLTIRKVLITDDGSTATVGDFSYSVNGATPVAFPASGETTMTVNAGTYTVTEPSSAAFTTTYNNCTSVVIANGGSATCTITNDDKPATLIVNKVVENNYGGTSTAGDFNFSVNGATATAFEADGSNSLTVDAGTYTVTETPPSGYEASFDNCEGLEIGNGETATCTITNRDRPVTLVVNKVVINDDGGTAGADDFSFTVNGGDPTQFEADGSNTAADQSAGDYTIREPQVAGYETTYSAGCTTDGAANGDTVTCTITNDDRPATLTVQKVLVTDNGSQAVLGDFSFTIIGGGQAPIDRAFTTSSIVTEVPAGNYDVTENLTAEQVEQFATTYAGCSDIQLVNGGEATCVITNNDRAATLIVRKVVSNDNGGTATADDFSFTVNGGAETSFEADGENAITVNAGTYTVVETAASGYTTTYDNCSQLRIANGASATCTITNSDDPVTLIVRKTVINDNGGTKTAGDFSFQVNGGTATPFTENAAAPLTGENRITDLSAGGITVTEVADAGYTTTYSAGCSSADVTNGTTVTCLITNNDRAATLIIRKVVINDNGGTKTAGDFSFQVNDGAATAFEQDGANPLLGENSIDVSAGTYSVSEVADPGYAASLEGCTDLRLANGATATCTITNNDRQGTLVITKVVTNDDGGTLPATAFSYQLNGDDPVAFAAGAAGAGTSGPLALDAGTHTVTEPATVGYRATNECAEVVVRNGQETSCTITNDDIAPRLTLIKVVDNGDIEGSGPGAFTLTASATGEGDDSRDISRAGNVTTSAAVFAGVTYELGETGPSGYDPAGPYVCENTDPANEAINWTQEGNGVQLALGAEVTCTITNRVRDLAIAKRAVGGPFEPGDTITYEVVVTNTGAATIPFDDITVSDPMLGEGLALVSEPAALEPGAELLYRGTRAVTVEDCGVITNTATVAIPRDANDENNSATVRTDVQCSIDLELTKTSDKDTYTPGETIVYTIVVRNVGTGSVPVEAIQVSDPILGQLTRQVEVPDALAPGETLTYTGRRLATTALCGTLVNTATVTTEGDTNTQNNSGSRTVRVAGGSCIQGPRPTRLSIDKVGPTTASHGRNVTYRLVVRNIGTVASFNTIVTDPLPKGLTLRSVPAGATLRAGVVTWRLGTMQPGARRVLTLVVRSTGATTLRRCNVGFARSDNAPRVSDRACTRFVRVAGGTTPGVTG